MAPDLRGFGDTDAPVDPSSYTCLHVVGDLVALLDAVSTDQEKVFVVGHDWGALIAWYLCLFRPDRVKALVNLSVQFFPRDPQNKTIESIRGVYGDDYYMCRFQVRFTPSEINLFGNNIYFIILPLKIPIFWKFKYILLSILIWRCWRSISIPKFEQQVAAVI
jgi:pimeloyl-ACP methyl ester carboxylesterase